MTTEITKLPFPVVDFDTIAQTIISEASGSKAAIQTGEDRVQTGLDRQASQAWAESPTPPDPDDATSKSSKTWAGISKSAANRAETARDDAQGVLPDRLRRDVPTLLADTALTYTADQPGSGVPGDIVRTRAEGVAYEWAASSASDHHVTTAGGVKLYRVGPLAEAFAERADFESAPIDPPVHTVTVGDTFGRIVTLERAAGGNYIDGASGAWRASATFYQPPPVLVAKVPGDFPDWETAALFLARLRPRYAASSGNRLVIQLQAGYQPTAGIRAAECIDMSHIRITSVDAIVEVDDSFTGRLIDVAGSGAHGPLLDCVIDQKGLGSHGYFLNEAAFGAVGDGGGIINCGDTALYLNRFARLNVQGGTSANLKPFSGANGNGVWLDHECQLHARFCDFSDAGRHCINSQARGYADIEGSSLRRSGRLFVGNGINANHDSQIHARSTVGGGHNGSFVLSQGNAVVNLFSAEAMGSSLALVEASSGRVFLQNAKLYRAGYVWDDEGEPDINNPGAGNWAVVNANRDCLTLNDDGLSYGPRPSVGWATRRGLFVTTNAECRHEGLRSESNGAEAVRVQNNGSAYINAARVGNSGVTNDLVATGGGQIFARGVRRLDGTTLPTSNPSAGGPQAADATVIWGDT